MPKYLLFAALLAAVPSARAADLNNATFLPILTPSPPCLYGNYYIDDTPVSSGALGGWNMVVSNLGADALARFGFQGFLPPPFGVPLPLVNEVQNFGQFSGYGDSEFGAIETRRSRAATTSVTGPSAFGLSCRGARFFLTSFATPYGTSAPKAAYEFRWKEWGERHGGFTGGSSASTPFAMPESDLMAQAYFAAPYLLLADRADAPGMPAALLGLELHLEHLDTRDEITFSILALDPRAGGLERETVTCAALSSPCTPEVSTHFSRTTRYATLSPYSAEAHATVWSDRQLFRVHLTPENLRAALEEGNRLRAENGEPPMPVDLERYALTKLAARAELSYAQRAGADPNDAEARDNVSLGATVVAMGAYEAR